MVCVLLVVNAIVLPAGSTGMLAALVVDGFAIAVTLLWLPVSWLLYSIDRSATDAIGPRLKKWSLIGTAAGIVVAVVGVGLLVTGQSFGGVVAQLGALAAVGGLLTFGAAHLLVDRPRVSAKNSFGFSGVVVGVAAIVALLMVTQRGIETEFVPPGEAGSIYMTLSYPAGTPLAKTQAAADLLESKILAVDGVQKVITTTGSKPSGFGSTIGGSYARIYAGMDKSRRRETNRAMRDLRKLSRSCPARSSPSPVKAAAAAAVARSSTRCPARRT